MAIPKTGKSKNGQPMHYSVGALIKKGDRYLLIDRAILPFGFAGLAGHVDEGEIPRESLKREVKEESGLDVGKCKLLFEEELDWNWCSTGMQIHYWYLYECEVTGKMKRSFEETKSIGWYTADEIKELTLEPAWKYWFEKLGIIEK